MTDLPPSPEPLPPGGFRIFFHESSSPRIESGDGAGRTYADHRLADLRSGNALPASTGWIEEVPSFPERGFMLDISRCRVPTMDFLFRLVEWLEILRFNQLQLYTEHTFAYREHRTVWEGASPMTAAQIRVLDDFCRDHHIELVPNQNCFGHMERWLKHQEYRDLAECPEGFVHPLVGKKDCGSTLCPGDESIRFVDGLLAELLPLFRSGKVNIGGDEPWDLGQGRNRERAGKEGKHEVYLEFLSRLLDLAGCFGKEPIFWADIVLEHPQLVPRIPPRAVPAIWGYHADHPFAEQCGLVASAGFAGQFQVVPGTSTWNSFSGRLDNASRNIRTAAAEGSKHGARGLVLTCWGDGGHHQPTPTLFPPLILAARAVWGFEPVEDSLASAIDSLFYPDSTGGNGAALCALGVIDSLLPLPNLNQSFLHKAFFANEAEVRSLAKTVGEEELEAVADSLAAIAGEGLDPPVILSRDMNAWAVDRCLSAKEARNGDALPSRLDRIAEEFRRIWLLDSRSGGLEESIGRFPVFGSSAPNHRRGA